MASQIDNMCEGGEEIDTNAHGGKGTKLAAALTEVPPLALLEVGKRMKLGALKYGAKNWHDVLLREELDHLLVHAVKAVHILDLLGASPALRKELINELTGAACRALMALETAMCANTITLTESPYDF